MNSMPDKGVRKTRIRLALGMIGISLNVTIRRDDT